MNETSSNTQVIKGDKYRISVLTDRLIRLEYSSEGCFEDRKSFAVINRKGIGDGFSCDIVTDSDDELVVETDSLLLTYDKKEFSSYGLSIKIKDMGTVWNYGDNYTDWSNLGGTARTLDDADGRVPLEKGIFGRNGYAVIDDSKTPVMENGEFLNRAEGVIDVYFFGYGKDYYRGLKDFCSLCGKMPMVPRYAFGNWWSRYYKYTEDSYMEVVENFAKEEIPLSVAVIDMDWHITEIDPKYGSGWTGYSWNKDYFPDYKRFLRRLHDSKLAVTLNLHPADGIRPFEDMYEDMARAVGQESGTESDKGVEFDFGDKKFRYAYFETVMHPYEKDGVDFWWIDWQQGTGKKCGDVDPLLLLNHYHYEDQEKRNLRPMIFSRYAGVGSHRYPVGFSGDTHVTWKSLEFQPYFTSTASNIAYGMWSHDIGGHMLGDKNLDRLVRWIEYGVFSPIMRIHSSCSPFFNKEPWLLDEPYRGIVRKFMRLRHGLIPYLYTENHRAYAEDKPLVRPMYYDYAQTTESYDVGKQYKFGESLIACAITCPNDEELRLGCTRALIPAGRWYDIFNGLIYDSDNDRVMKLYRDLAEIPVLLPAGGIVPMAVLEGENLNHTGNPNAMRILIGAGADGEYTLYEDDGISMNYRKGAFAETRFAVSYDASRKKIVFTIDPAKGDVSLTPSERSYELVFYGVRAESASDKSGELSLVYEAGSKDSQTSCNGLITSSSNVTIVRIHATRVDEQIVVELDNVTLLENDYKKLVYDILDRAWISTNDKEAVYCKLQSLDRCRFAKWLRTADVSENLKSAIEEVL
ncbi:glycoside hydrolase family 31 protein [Butyrivibrio sp. VCB2006]|uniref:glycoside hydrolase family 31 protein n=1 Tax=Butyrivibrio sp. VCB2006 TaxID=1280679 RepID=UPI0003F85D8F|nr:glycoside hydrolase family 31 protein [Butyrivibrio sp. VCB2006]